MEVRKIDKNTAKLVVEAKHYSKRLGIFWEGFGLFVDGILRGVVCYGQPSAPIQKHAFSERNFRLYELTRLVVDKGICNGASFLIGRSLKMLSERPCAVVSYADSQQGHCGIVYQATNWTYTGATLSHDCLYLVNGEKMHPMTIRDKFKVTEIAKWAKECGHDKIKPMPKHRYFYFIGSKVDIKNMKMKLNYASSREYPKTNKTTYEDGENCNFYLGGG